MAAPVALDEASVAGAFFVASGRIGFLIAIVANRMKGSYDD